MTQNKTEIRKMRILDLMEEPSYVPMREKELACIMQVDPEDKPGLKRILQELLTEGKRTVFQTGAAAAYRSFYQPSKGLWLCTD